MRRSLRQTLAGFIALPLSVGPFVAYASLTQEGRLLRDRVMVAINPPQLPTLSSAELTAARAMAPRYRNAVTALVYHGIGSGSDGDDRFVLSPERFGEHLAVLRAAGMNAVTARQVADAVTSGRPLPPNAVMISFDDGRGDALRFADPLLKQAGMRATMFVITSKAADPGLYYASWSRLEAASRSGRWDLESHTADAHREQPVADGRSLPALTSLAPGEGVAAYRARVRADLARASAAIARHTGQRPVAFAYPFGAFGADRTNAPAIRTVLKEEITRQYALAFHQEDQETVPLVTADQPRAGLRRLEVGDWPALKLLARIARAVPPSTPSAAPVVAPPTDAQVVPPETAPAPPATVGPQAAAAPSSPTTARSSVRRSSGSSATPTSGSSGGWTRPLLPATAPPATSPRMDPPRTTSPTTAKPRSTTPTTKPPATKPPATTTPTTAAPTNCGGQAHGKPCKH